MHEEKENRKTLQSQRQPVRKWKQQAACGGKIEADADKFCNQIHRQTFSVSVLRFVGWADTNFYAEDNTSLNPICDIGLLGSAPRRALGR